MNLPDAKLPFDWGALTEAQRQTLYHRKAMLDGWCGASERTLYRWLRGWQRAEWAGLLDGRRGGAGGDEKAGEFLDYLKDKYLDGRKRGVSLCYTLACDKAEEVGWAVPFSLRRAQQILAALDRKVSAYHREGPRKFDGSHGKYVIRDYSQMQSNELWVSDGHDFNVFVLHDEKLIRPTLISWMDVRSRLSVGWRITGGAENADAILSAFRMGVAACGLPQGVYTDNGKSYRAGALQAADLGVFDRLGIKTRFARPYNAKAKIIERWHRTIDERFSKRFETYCGDAARGTKPFDLEEQKAGGKAPTLDEFAAAFEAWLEADYHNRAHEGLDGKTPAQVYAENLGEVRPMSAELLELEICRRQRVTVGRNGVTISGITYEAPELDSRAGQELTALIDNATVGRVRILDERGKFLCEATSMREVPANATPEQLREAMAGIKRDRKRVKAAKAIGMRLADDPIERMHRVAEAKRAAAPKPAPTTIRPVRSALEPDLAAIRLAKENRVDDEPASLRIGELFRGERADTTEDDFPSLADVYRREASA